METKQRGRPQSDGRAKKAGPANEKSTQTSQDTISGAQVGSALTAAIEDEQLMLDQNRLGDDGTKTPRTRQPSNCHDQMKEKDSNFAHPGILSKSNRTCGSRNSPGTGGERATWGLYASARTYQ